MKRKILLSISIFFISINLMASNYYVKIKNNKVYFNVLSKCKIIRIYWKKTSLSKKKDRVLVKTLHLGDSNKISYKLEGLEEAQKYFLYFKYYDADFNKIYENSSFIVTPLSKRKKNKYYASILHKNYHNLKLKRVLQKIISRKITNKSYKKARDLFFGFIDNDGMGNVECIYTGLIGHNIKNARTAAKLARFNTEHVWPQSLFNKAAIPKSDLHHIFPCDMGTNSKRGIYLFGNPKKIIWKKRQAKLGTYKGKIYFSPRPERRGDIARAVFYMSVRYMNEPKFNKKHGSFNKWKIDEPMERVLRKWSKQDPPDQTEKNRNYLIFRYQGNLNPFVDYPELIDKIKDF